jgi:hypothetical protein
MTRGVAARRTSLFSQPGMQPLTGRTMDILLLINNDTAGPS